MSKPFKKPSESAGKGETGEKIPQKFGSVRKTTEQIMQRHLRDKNDVITEEDFINLDIEPGIPEDKTAHPLQVTDDTDLPKDDESKDTKVITPWDTIS